MHRRAAIIPCPVAPCATRSAGKPAWGSRRGCRCPNDAYHHVRAHGFLLWRAQQRGKMLERRRTRERGDIKCASIKDIPDNGRRIGIRAHGPVHNEIYNARAAHPETVGNFRTSQITSRKEESLSTEVLSPEMVGKRSSTVHIGDERRCESGSVQGRRRFRADRIDPCPLQGRRVEPRRPKRWRNSRTAFALLKTIPANSPRAPMHASHSAQLDGGTIRIIGAVIGTPPRTTNSSAMSRDCSAGRVTSIRTPWRSISGV